MAELLLELFSEEIPARMQDRAREDLARLLGEALTAAGIGFAQPLRSFATPRRLTVVATGLPLQLADRVVERKGPRADAPEQARAGFLRGLAGQDYGLEEREDRKARVLFALVRERGRAVAELLAELLPQAIGRLPWPKSMRWGAGDFRWVRPLQSVLCLLDGAVVPFAVGGVAAGDRTRGHRFLAPEPFAVRDFADYVVRLRDARVILDGAERRALIDRGAQELAATEGLALAPDPVLLDELKGLVEWPVPLAAGIDEEFMTVPPEVLVTTMRANQKFLALRTPAGVLARRFVLVANMEASDGGAAIVAGNERVLRARLWDAKFFWDQDRKVALESRLPALDRVVFHAELGTQGQRVERLVALAGALVPHVPGSDRVSAERAALLAKADLVSGMVGEFPELQGIMGGHYAAAQGESPRVATAIREHYSPKGPDDRCPTAPESVVVALADKMDLLVGMFAAGEIPTGSKDPFGVRRAAIGIIRLILENGCRISLRALFHLIYMNYVKNNNKKSLDSIGELVSRYDDLRQLFSIDEILAASKGIVLRSVLFEGEAWKQYRRLASQSNAGKGESDPEIFKAMVNEVGAEIASFDFIVRLDELMQGHYAHKNVDEQKLDDNLEEYLDSYNWCLERFNQRSSVVTDKIMTFVLDRMKVFLRENGIRYDLVSAVISVSDEDDLVRLVERSKALQRFIVSEDGHNLLSAFRRAANIVAIEEKKDGRRYDGVPAAGALVEPAELTLLAALDDARGDIDRALAEENYGVAMAALAKLRHPVDAFFSAAMVNVPEPELRLNRLLLLSRIRSALQRVADFSLVEDQRREGAM